MTASIPVGLTLILEPIGHALAVRSWLIVAVLVGTLIALTLLNLVAPLLGLIDIPDGSRKRHPRPMPLTGGLAILCGVWTGMLVRTETGASAGDILALLGIVATVHAFDDQSGLSSRQRLVIDGVIALAFTVITGNVIESLGSVDGRFLHLGLLAAPFTIFIYVALTNAYNMMDGLDGLALSQFLIALVSIGLFHLAHAQTSGFAPHAFAVVVASALILLANLGLLGSFLRCFLGDSGARFLGFFLVYVLIMEGNRVLSPVAALFFVALPLLDLCAVVATRLRAGAGPMMPDRRHIHHLLVDAGASPSLTVLILAGLSCAMIGVYTLLDVLDCGDLVVAGTFLLIAGLYWQGRPHLVAALCRGLRPHPAIGPAE